MVRWSIMTLMLSLLALPAWAVVNKVEVIAGVMGTSPLDAQQKAVDYAKKRAFFLTLSKLAPGKAEEIAKSLTTDQIYAHVRGYELIEDKIDNEDPNYYLAKYHVSVSEDMVQRLLVNDGANLNQEANPIVVLPVLRDGDRILFWEDDNIWRSIWNGLALELGEGLLVMPYGDPTDRLITDSSTVLSYDFAALSDIAQRYGAGEIVVAVATYVRDQAPAGVEVVLRRLGPDVNKIKSLYYETDDRNETPESVLPDAARSVAAQLTEIAKTYQGEQLRRIANATKTALRAEFRRITDWADIQKKLNALPRVIQLDIDAISIQSADATLMYETKPENMLEIMRANGLFVRADGEKWIVELP